MDWTWYLFSFNGRINRAKMWLAVLIIICWMIFLGGLILAIGSLFGGVVSISFGVNEMFAILDPVTWRSQSSAELFSTFAGAIVTPLFVWVYFATSIKRLHDRNKSGWWAVSFCAVPSLYSQFADRLGGDYWMLAMPFGLIAFVFCIWGFVEMYCLKGSRKTNRFGPNPLLPVDTRPRWEQTSEIEMVPHKAGPPPMWRVRPEV
jgi:uncharacterized membrane protein YhaH (DUF805 family)